MTGRPDGTRIAASSSSPTAHLHIKVEQKKAETGSRRKRIAHAAFAFPNSAGGGSEYGRGSFEAASEKRHRSE